MPNIGTKSPPYKRDLHEAFLHHCEHYAFRYSKGELTLHQSVDWLQDWSFTRGLLEVHGQDHVQTLMAQAFLPYRGDLS